MRKYIFLILFFVVLVLPWIVSRFVREKEAPVSADALILDIVTPHNQDIRNVFGEKFSAWHQQHYGKPVIIRFNSPGGTGDITRLLQAVYRDVLKDGKLTNSDFHPPADIVWGGGDYFFEKDIKSYLQPLNLPPELLKEAFPEPSLAGVRLYDYNADGKAPKWVGICISAFGIVYSPDVYRRLDIPAPITWTDLARPELSGYVALADPMSSSSAAVSYSMVYQRAMADAEETYLQSHPELARLSDLERMKDREYFQAIKGGWKQGMGQLLLIAANGRYITDSGSQPPNDVANGDAAAAMAIDFYGRANEDAVGKDRLTVVIPKGATAINPDPAAILIGVSPDRYELSNRFISYLLSPEAQQLWIAKPGTPGGPPRALFRPPVRKDAYTPEYIANWTHPDLNPFTDASGFNQRDAWGSLFSETRFIWAVSWIDSREELKKAYKAVLAVSDPARRDELRKELADFPLEYDDVAKLRADLREVRSKTPAAYDEFRARERIRLADLFRTHYREIEKKARAPQLAGAAKS